MKITNGLTSFTCITFALLGTLTEKAEATVVMEMVVNSDTGIVLMRTSTGFSDADVTIRLASAGITIENFFTSNVTYPETTVVSGTLTSNTLSPVPSGSKTYDRLGTFEYSANDAAFAAGNDLSMFKNSGDNPDQVFTTTTQAFTGESTVDFGATTAALPGLGATGNVISGFWSDGRTENGVHSQVIGQWEVVAVVPEPSSMALLGLGGLGLMLRLRRR